MSNRSLRMMVLIIAAVLAPLITRAQDNSSATAASTPGEVTAPVVTTVLAQSALIVQEFTVKEDTGWPYDLKQLQSQSVAELKAKCGEHLDVFVSQPVTPRTHTYILAGEIVSWHPGNRAKRMMIGMGSGRETAEIRYWLSDEKGTKVFEHKDTIRAEFWGNAYEGSVGQLAHPFASKIAGRLSEAKLF